MLLDLLERGRAAEARLVLVGAVGVVLRAPSVVSAGDQGDILVGQLAVRAVHERTHLPGVDEESFAGTGTIALGAVSGLLPGEEPETHGDRGRVEELPGQRDHAVHQVGLNDGLADVTLAGSVRGHGAIGQHKAGGAVRGQVIEEVLNPCIIGVAAVHGDDRAVLLLALTAFGGRAILPADVVGHLRMAPVLHVERGIGKDEVGAEILLLVVEEAVAPLDVCIDAPDGQVHERQPPGGVVGLLAEDRDLALGLRLALAVAIGGGVFGDELGGRHEHAARTAAGVVDAPLEGLQHLDQQPHHALGRVELAAALAFLLGEPGQEVLVDAAENILLAALGIAQADGGDQVDQLPEPGLVQRRARVVLGENALELDVVALDGLHRIVHQLADARLLGALLQVGPPCLGGHPEDVLGQVLVAVLGLGVVVDGQPVVHLHERIGDVLEEDQPEHDVLVLRRVHGAAQLVGCGPQLVLEAEIGSCPVCHVLSFLSMQSGVPQGSLPSLSVFLGAALDQALGRVFSGRCFSHSSMASLWKRQRLPSFCPGKRPS